MPDIRTRGTPTTAARENGEAALDIHSGIYRTHRARGGTLVYVYRFVAIFIFRRTTHVAGIGLFTRRYLFRSAGGKIYIVSRRDRVLSL